MLILVNIGSVDTEERVGNPRWQWRIGEIRVDDQNRYDGKDNAVSEPVKANERVWWPEYSVSISIKELNVLLQDLEAVSMRWDVLGSLIFTVWCWWFSAHPLSVVPLGCSNETAILARGVPWICSSACDLLCGGTNWLTGMRNSLMVLRLKERFSCDRNGDGGDRTDDSFFVQSGHGSLGLYFLSWRRHVLRTGENIWKW